MALIGASVIAIFISVDGESNGLERAKLIVLYIILGLPFYCVP